MFKIKDFSLIFDLLERKEKILAQKKLTYYRQAYGLHPDYLFLMSKYLVLDKRYYQSIDTLLASLKINIDVFFLTKNNFECSDDTVTLFKFKLMSHLFKLINDSQLSIEANSIKSVNDQENFIIKLSELMPGVKLKKD